MVKDSLFLLILNLLGRGFGAVTGPTNDEERFVVSADDKGFSVSADFKSFGKGVWGQKGVH